MTPDLITRLKSRSMAESQTLTPNRIDIMLRTAASGRSVDLKDPAEQVIQNLLPEVAQKLVSEKKKDKFRSRIIYLLDEYTPSQLTKMDAECLKDDGRIDTARLDEILFKE